MEHHELEEGLRKVLQPVRAPDGFGRRLRERIAAGETAEFSPARRLVWSRRAWMAAAALLVLVMTGTWLLQRPAPSGQPSPAAWTTRPDPDRRAAADPSLEGKTSARQDAAPAAADSRVVNLNAAAGLSGRPSITEAVLPGTVQRPGKHHASPVLDLTPEWNRENRLAFDRKNNRLIASLSGNAPAGEVTDFSEKPEPECRDGFFMVLPSGISGIPPLIPPERLLSQGSKLERPAGEPPPGVVIILKKS